MKFSLGITFSILLLSLTLSACTQAPENSTPETSRSSESSQTLASLAEITVYKSATCGCCQAWVSYIREAGYSVEAIDHDNMSEIKEEHGLGDPALQSCHTAIVDGYVIEGHVPVNDIQRLLAEKPDIIGLTAPGMPMMSPGMGSETPRDYDVLAVERSGQTSVYSSY